ncbi:hypothetical protein BaRGS_00016338 [Batillaria attramentaria]|uniref:Uncharacterized protein n=1 Tax=Batillaria attramentaria TaxID=370345 RepID=A0ABD0KZF7_9CAEN
MATNNTSSTPVSAALYYTAVPGVGEIQQQHLPYQHLPQASPCNVTAGLEWQQQQPPRQPLHLQFQPPTSPSWQQQHMANSFHLKHQQPQAAATVLPHPVQGDVPVPFSVNPFPVLYGGQVAQVTNQLRSW